MPNRITNVHVCDATNDDSSNDADLIKREIITINPTETNKVSLTKFPTSSARGGGHLFSRRREKMFIG